MLAILAVIILAFVGGQAYAKYFTKVKGTGMAEIATWSFKVNGEREQVQSINLASTVNDETLVDNKIAPGTILQQYRLYFSLYFPSYLSSCYFNFIRYCP